MSEFPGLQVDPSFLKNRDDRFCSCRRGYEPRRVTFPWLARPAFATVECGFPFCDQSNFYLCIVCPDIPRLKTEKQCVRHAKTRAHQESEEGMLELMSYIRQQMTTVWSNVAPGHATDYNGNEWIENDDDDEVLALQSDADEEQRSNNDRTVDDCDRFDDLQNNPDVSQA